MSLAWKKRFFGAIAHHVGHLGTPAARVTCFQRAAVSCSKWMTGNRTQSE